MIKENTIKQNKFSFILFSLVLFTMSLSVVTINIGFSIRIGQILTLLMFAFVLLDDLKEKKLNEFLLLFFVFFAIFIILISKNSSYSKIGEFKFIIKYLLIFPATFYIGYWSILNFSIKNFLSIIENILFIYVFLGFILWIIPIPGLYHDRGELTGFQGTFFEAGWFALVVGSFLLTSILLRIDYTLEFSKRIKFLYLITFLSIVLSKNKTVWIGVIVIISFLAIFKSILANKENIRDSVKKLNNINSLYFIMFILILVILFFIINFILPEPIISMAMIEDKLNNERGKAYLVAVNLLEQSNWLGGYGLGYIQQYFSVYTDEIIGLDGESGMLFNSYLDVWISAGVIGVIYHFLLIKFALSRSHLYTLIIPIYWFISANTNPTIGDEYYYLFLGISYGLVLKHKKGLNK